MLECLIPEFLHYHQLLLTLCYWFFALTFVLDWLERVSPLDFFLLR